MSEYIFRGVGQSDGKPAVQGGFDYDGPHHAFVGTWASSASHERPVEIDLYGGYSPQISEDVFAEARLTGFIYPHDTDGNTAELKLAVYPAPIGAAYHYDFVLEQHYAEVGGRHDNGNWWFTGRVGMVVGAADEELQALGPQKPSEDSTPWDWEVKVGYSLTGALNVKAGATGQQNDGERVFVAVEGVFSLLAE